MKTNQRKFSEEHLRYLRKQRNDKIITVTAQISILVLFLLLWEFAARFGWIDAFIFSCPSRICRMIGQLASTGELWYHTWVTLYENILGFILSTLIGTLIAVLLWWFLRARKVLDPYIVVLNSLPKIALGPIIIIWCGAGTKAIVFMAILISVIITILNMLTAFLSCDKNKILLLQSMGANKFQILTKLILPHSTPAFLSVLKINVGMSWVGTIMGEYLVSKAGLGYLIVYGGQVFKLDLVMASTVVLCVLAAVMYCLVSVLEKYLYRKRQ